MGGVTQLIGGTSASSPTFASIVALVNDHLVASGKPVLGFLNPFLYSVGSGAFTDITIGKNVGFTCPDSAVRHGIGNLSSYTVLTPGFQVAFTAGKGWDPLTGEFQMLIVLYCMTRGTDFELGFGTPIFSKLLEIAFLH